VAPTGTRMVRALLKKQIHSGTLNPRLILEKDQVNDPS
jgi:hypothetical protein